MVLATLLVLLVVTPGLTASVSVNVAPLEDPKECKWTSNDGHVYDFTSLENPSADYAIVSDNNPQGNTYTYYYNFCAGTTGRTGACIKGETAVCLNDPKDPTLAYSLGGVSSAKWSEFDKSDSNQGIEIAYASGGSDGRNTVVKIKCNLNVDTVYFTGAINKASNEKRYEIIAESKLACRDGPPSPPSPPGPSPPSPPPLPECKYRDISSGLLYDLTKLQLASPYNVKVEETPKLVYEHSIGVCNFVRSCDDVNIDPTRPEVASCQSLETPSGQPVPKLGKANGYLANMELKSIGHTVFGQQGVVITYTGSSENSCRTDTNSRGLRKTVVEVLCSATPIAPDPILKYISEDPKCSYNYVLESVQACGIAEGKQEHEQD